MALEQPVFDKIFETVERGTWLNQQAQARVPAPPLPPPPTLSTALEAVAAKAAIDTLNAAATVSAASNGRTWLPSTAGQTVSGGGGIAFGQTPGHGAANAGWSTGYGNLNQLGASANAIWGAGQARRYVEGWKFPFYVAKSYEAALSHCLIMQKAAAMRVEANFWGEVWALTKSAQAKAQGGARFD